MLTGCEVKNFERSYLIEHCLLTQIICMQFLRILYSSFREEDFQRFALN